MKEGGHTPILSLRLYFISSVAHSMRGQEVKMSFIVRSILFTDLCVLIILSLRQDTEDGRIVTCKNLCQNIENPMGKDFRHIHTICLYGSDSS